MSKISTIYLDYAAATPLDQRVLAVMQLYFTEQFYNPSAIYAAAQTVRKDYEAARTSLAYQLGVKSAELVLTSGATESINLALHGIMQVFPTARIAVGATEHASVIHTAANYRHTLIEVDASGLITQEALRVAVQQDTVLVSVGYVNSEIGTMQSIRRLVKVIKELRMARIAAGNALPLYFHTDASQAAAYGDLQVSRLGVDLMTLSAAKIYGPKQVGLLYVKAGTRLRPVTYGGSQEKGLRAGTENVAGVIGFAEALRLAREERSERTKKILLLRKRFEELFRQQFGESCFTLPAQHQTPHILHLHFDGIDAERLLLMLDERGVMVATGAACAANQQAASHTLTAIRLPDEAIQGSIRCSFGHTLTGEEIERAGQIIISCIKDMRRKTYSGA